MTRTAFTKQNLIKNGMFVEYVDASGDKKVVARFKRGSAATFMTCLRKHFTVEDYFAARELGASPMQIAETAGYVAPHIAKRLKAKGYEVSPAGFRQMIRDSIVD